MMVPEHLLHSCEGVVIDDGLVLSGVELVEVAHLADVRLVEQHAVDRALVERLPADLVARCRDPLLRSIALGVHHLEGFQERALVQVDLEHVADDLGLGFVHDEPLPLLLDVVSKDRLAAAPSAVLLRGGDLVARPLTDDLALVLSEREQEVQHQLPLRGCRVELLRRRREVHSVGLEEFPDLVELRDGPADAVDLVGDDDLDLAGREIGDELLERGPLERAARKPCI
ncbi:MAG TPA: hypothetical protein VGK67_13040 [Myxococcales bacterium]